MSLKDREWWPALVERLRFEPLAVLAREFGESMADLCQELSTIGARGPAQLTPWWPEARRLRNTTPIREIARRFHTNPRRIRRAMARTSLRVGGRELGSRGLPELQPYREQLGRVPDARIAKAAKVTIWAVQGERRRSNIAGFRPRPGAGKRGLSQDEEAWILGPARPRRDRMRVDPEAVQVVRRPGLRSGEPSRPTEAGRPGTSLRTRDEQPLEVAGRPAPARPTGTRRIIRPEEPVLAAPPPPAPPSVVRRPRRTPETTWRPVDPQVLELAEERQPPPRRAEPPPRPAPWTPPSGTRQALPERPPERPDAARRTALPARSEADRPRFPSVEGLRPVAPATPVEPVRRGRGRPPKPRPEPTESRVLPPVRPAPAPAVPSVRPVAAPAPVVAPPVIGTPVIGTPVAPRPAPVVVAVPPRPLQKWLAQGPEGLRLQIDAPDVLSAALRLKSILPAAQLAQVALVRM